MTINDYLDMEALDNILEQWAAATHMIAVVLDDVTPAFPKLIYVLDEHNCLKGGKYDYITKLAVKCSAKRLYPDYISAKKMRENYEGNRNFSL